MGFIELILIAIGLSMDAFAVSVCKGLKMRKIDYKQTVIIALFFGGFQALMPLLGWFLGKQFEHLITSIDHWVAFALLAFIGGKMIYDAVKPEKENKTCECGCDKPATNNESQIIEDSPKNEDCQQEAVSPNKTVANPKLDIKELFLMAVATSIDALAVGITFAFFKLNILPTVSIIGCTTFIIAFVGVIIGNKFGSKFEKKAELAGGIILVLIGLKILIEHLVA